MSLTKDEVVKMAREAGFSQDWQFAVPPATLSNFATICRAPLVAEVERLTFTLNREALARENVSALRAQLADEVDALKAENAALKQAHEINADTLNAMQVEIDDWKSRALKAEQAGKYICPVRTVADLVNNLKLMDQTLPIYGAQYIEHLGKSRCIATPPTVSRERIKDSRWIGEGDTLNAAVIWTRAEQPPQPAAQEPTSAVTANGKPKKAKPYAWRNPMNGVVISNDKKERLLCVGAGYPNFSEPLYAAGQQYLKENGK